MMTWEQKLAAIQALAGSYSVSLKMRKPGNWYVQAPMSIGGDGLLSGSYGNGCSPEEAVLDHWQKYTELPHGRYIVVDTGEDRVCARWNDFMWQTLSEEETRAIRERNNA